MGRLFVSAINLVGTAVLYVAAYRIAVAIVDSAQDKLADAIANRPQAGASGGAAANG